MGDKLYQSVGIFHLLVAALAILLVLADSDELLRGREECLRHEDFPSPAQCCSQPQWINRYAVHRCRFIHAEIDGSRYERGSCLARCGLYRINVSMTDRIERVRVFRPRLETRGVDPAWISAVLKALKFCKPKITSLQGRFVRNAEEMEQCEIAEDIFGDCVQAHMFMNCPRSTWIASGSCNAMRELLASGCPFKSLGEVVLLDDEGRVRDDDRTPYDDDAGYDRAYRPGRTENPRRPYDAGYDRSYPSGNTGGSRRRDYEDGTDGYRHGDREVS